MVNSFIKKKLVALPFFTEKDLIDYNVIVGQTKVFVELKSGKCLELLIPENTKIEKEIQLKLVKTTDHYKELNHCYLGPNQSYYLCYGLNPYKASDQLINRTFKIEKKQIKVINYQKHMTIKGILNVTFNPKSDLFFYKEHKKGLFIYILTSSLEINTKCKFIKNIIVYSFNKIPANSKVTIINQEINNINQSNFSFDYHYTINSKKNIFMICNPTIMQQSCYNE